MLQTHQRLCRLAPGLAAIAAGLSLAAGACADPIPPGWQASHMAPIGYIRTPGPHAFKLSIKETKDHRWYLFVADASGEPALAALGGGVDIIDVTDPKNPKLATVLQVPHASGQVTSHGDLLIAGQQLPLEPAPGVDVDAPWLNAKVEMNDLATLYDIKDPLHPVKLSTWRTLGWGSHRNVYPGGRYAFMSSWIAGYKGQAVLTILDVSDPRNPKEIGHWWQFGQKEGEPDRPKPNGFHGPVTVSPDGKMLTMGYTPGVVNLDFTDPANPKLIGKLDFSPLPLFGMQSIHTGLPFGDHLIHVSVEPAPPGCQGNLAFAAIVDNKDPAHPRLLTYYPRPDPPAGAPYKDFCKKDGRFGPHNVNAEIHLPEVQPPGDRIYQTYFNAGIRAYDVTDPEAPKETSWFLPKIGPWSSGERGMEDVLVDTRGNIYVTDGKAKGVWILRDLDPKGASHGRAD